MDANTNLENHKNINWIVEELCFQGRASNSFSEQSVLLESNPIEDFLDWQIENKLADFAIIPQSPLYVGQRPRSDSSLPLPNKIQVWPDVMSIKHDRKLVLNAAIEGDVLLFSTNEGFESVRNFFNERHFKVETSKSLTITQVGDSEDREWSNREANLALNFAARLGAKVVLYTAHDADPIYLLHR